MAFWIKSNFENQLLNRICDINIPEQRDWLMNKKAKDESGKPQVYSG